MPETIDNEGCPLPIPVPHGTKKRDSRIVDAYILWAHGDPQEPGEGRITCFKELARRVDMHNDSLRRARDHDGWEDFRLAQLAKTHEQTSLTIMGRSRNPVELLRLTKEKERQIKEIPSLQKEAIRCRLSLKEYNPGTPEHAACLRALESVTRMLEARTGFEQARKEEGEVFKAMVAETVKKGTLPGTKPDSVDQSKVVEL